MERKRAAYSAMKIIFGLPTFGLGAVVVSAIEDAGKIKELL